MLFALLALTTLAEPAAARTASGAKATELSKALRAVIVNKKWDLRDLRVDCHHNHVEHEAPVSCEVTGNSPAFTVAHDGAPAERLFKALVSAGATAEGAAGSDHVRATDLSCEAQVCTLKP